MPDDNTEVSSTATIASATETNSEAKPITAEESAKAANDDKERLKTHYDSKIIGMGLMEGGQASEIIDIVSKFPWTANPLKGGSIESVGSNTNISFSHNIPFCYVIERKQTVNSNIANFINTLKIGVDSILAGGKELAQRAANVSEEGAKRANEQKPNDGIKTQGLATQKNTDGNAAKNNGNGETPTATGQGDADQSFSDKSDSLINSGANKLLQTIGSIKDLYTKYVDNFLASTASDQLQTTLLSPYRYLYYTQETGKKYVFPMLAPTELLNLNNSYGNDSKSIDLFGIGELAKQGADMAAGAMNILNFINQAGNDNKGKGRGMEEQYSEMAKSFSYSPGGQELQISFPLYNTVKKGCWIQNYRFIIGFLLRNLPFKVSAYSYKPPLLYDVLVPGTTHLPLCYVSNINVQSYGIIRQITCKNFIKEVADLDGSSTANNMQVPVPEAWFLTIKFKCLLSNSSNLILDLANSPININVTTV